MTTAASDLVPLADRQRGLELFRAASAALVLLVQWRLPAVAAPDAAAMYIGTLTYIAALASASAVWRILRRRGLRLFGAMLIADGVWLAWVTWLTGGVSSPLQALLLLHVVVVALLAGYRTGAKLALWHSLLLLQLHFAEQAQVLSPPPAVRPGAGGLDQALAFMAGYWLCALGTASFSAVNERELRRRRADLEALAVTAAELEGAVTSDEVVTALLTGATRSFGFARAVVFTSPDGLLTAAGVHGLATPVAAWVAPPGGLVQTAAERRTTLLVREPDPVLDAAFRASFPGARNLLAVPLLNKSGTVGVLVAEHGLRHGSRVERQVVSMVERFASQAALALRGAWLLEQVQRLAEHDGLTGVRNRLGLDTALAEQMEHSLQTGEPFTLGMVDIDHFKELNDRHGHAHGDAVLRAAAQALDGVCRPVDVAARYGGEEFAVLRRGCGSAAGAIVGERLRRAIATCADPGITASVGLASFPEDAQTLPALMAAADRALYAAKRRGRNRVVTAAALAEEAWAPLDQAVELRLLRRAG